jgi:acyl carrier protein
MEDLSFEEFAEFIREWWKVSRKKLIMPETQFERDLGLTGDDGIDLLEATQNRFDVKLATEEDGFTMTFNLTRNEYLFHSEGWGPSPQEILSIFSGRGATTVRAFTVGELFNAVKKALQEMSGNKD